MSYFLFSAVSATIQNNLPLAIGDIVASVVLIGNLFDLFGRKQIRFNILLGLSVISFLYIFLYATGGTDQTAFVWYFTYPLIACYLLGSFYGIIATLLMIIPVIVVGFFGSETPDGGGIHLTAELTDGALLVAGHCEEKAIDQKPRLNTSRRRVRISVTDTGIGLTLENLECIFDPLNQVEHSTSRRFQGTGLGLSLTRQLVELHGGRLWAESEGEGKGCTFRLVIPV